MNMQSEGFCELEGEPHDPVTVRSVNGVINRLGIGHLKPMKEALTIIQTRQTNIESKLDNHINEVGGLLLKISGGMTALKYVGIGAIVLIAVTSPPDSLAVKILHVMFAK